MIKPIEQLDKYNQKIKLVVEQRNGEPVSLDKYLTGLLKTQSLEAWRGDSEKLGAWASNCVAQYLANCEFHIWGYSADSPVVV